MDKLRFGTGGVPLTTPKSSTLEGIKHIRKLGLDHMELEFVQGVRMKQELAMEVNQTAQSNDVSLSVHGPYYVNLAAEDNRIFYGSINYIAESIYIGGLAGAKSVTFHPAFYQKKSPQEVYSRVSTALTKVYEEFKTKAKFKDHPIQNQLIAVAPELTGKPTQFGDLEELVSLIKDFKDQNLRFCFDFAHKFARSNGNFNNYDKFMQMLDYIATQLGSKFLEDMHIHISGIMYNPKGERNHVSFLENYQKYQDQGIDVAGGKEIMLKLEKLGKAGGSTFDWQGLLQALKNAKVKGMVVCESPNLELDALLMQQYYLNC